MVAGRSARAAMAGVLALTLACSTESELAQRLTQSPDRALESGSASMKVVSEIQIQHVGGTMKVTSTSEGRVDFESMRSEVTIDAQQSGEAAIPTRPCRIVTDGGTTYLQVPDSQRGRTDGRPWLKVDVAAASGVDQNTIAADPTASLSYIKGASGEVKDLGTEDVGGTPTTHYRFTVERGRLLEQIEDTARRDALRTHLEQLKVDSIPYDAWLDGEGRPRKTSFRMKAADALFDMRTTLEMSDFGAPVQVEVPPADQVSPAPDQQVAYSICFDSAPPG